jgi:hypothetical protein
MSNSGARTIVHAMRLPNVSSPPGLTRRSMLTAVSKGRPVDRSSLFSAWIAGSSPAMTNHRKKGGEAPKGASRPLSAPFLPWEGRRSGPDGDRSPSGAPLRRLPRRANARTQSRPRFTRNTMRRRYLRLESRLSEAPRTPVIMPEGIAVCLGANCVHLFALPGPPGSGVTSPARRNRTRSINWLSPVDVPDVSETARLAEGVTRRESETARKGGLRFANPPYGPSPASERGARLRRMPRCPIVARPSEGSRNVQRHDRSTPLRLRRS